jgi:hypothetical protein
MKKGVSLETAMITLAIFAIVAFSLFFFYRDLFQKTEGQYTRFECQSSLLTAQAVDKAQPHCITEITNPVPLSCNRNFLTIDEDKIIKNAEETFYDPTCPSGGQTCLAKNAIAEEMASCWATFFEGEKIVFQQLESKQETLLGTNTACFVCGEFTLRTKEDIHEFKDHLKSMKRSNGQSYFDYLSEHTYCDEEYLEGTTCWEGVAKRSSSPIDTSYYKSGESYAVVFMRIGVAACDGPEDKDDLDPPTFSVQVIPTKNLLQHCNMVIT